jgi:hypothetical protein
MLREMLAEFAGTFFFMFIGQHHRREIRAGNGSETEKTLESERRH